MSTPFFASIIPRHPTHEASSLHKAKPATAPLSDHVSNRRPSASAHSASSASPLPLNSLVAEEYRTAGQPLHRELHPFPFPHAALKEGAETTPPPPRSESSMSLDSQLSNTDISAQSDESGVEAVPNAEPSSDTTLRQQHYTVLTSLLHRCLMERDYRRATRAWGMLLRLELHGHPLDIRAQGRWGIGAELLLHSNGNVDAQPSPENLMKAKDYYERLILQYPYRKHSPDAVSALTFYPVMFGIWIYAIQLRYQTAVQDSVGLSSRDSSPEAERAYENEVGQSRSNLRQTAVRIQACQIAAEQANEVVKKLSELLISPPYSDHSGLWKTQGMSYLWLNQLLHQDPKEDPRERQNALRQSSEAFSRAVKEGATIDSKTLEDVGLSS
ncbi:MAG: hypothetical protein Q9168_001395 [Polycauliona sp. 1 TL-2023]